MTPRSDASSWIRHLREHGWNKKHRRTDWEVLSCLEMTHWSREMNVCVRVHKQWQETRRCCYQKVGLVKRKTGSIIILTYSSLEVELKPKSREVEHERLDHELLQPRYYVLGYPGEGTSTKRTKDVASTFPVHHLNRHTLTLSSHWAHFPPVGPPFEVGQQ